MNYENLTIEEFLAMSDEEAKKVSIEHLEGLSKELQDLNRFKVRPVIID